jgi:acylphosphatase
MARYYTRSSCNTLPDPWRSTRWYRSSANPLKVAGEAQGEEACLQKFLKDINEGPKHAHVVKVEKSTIDTKDGESSFETG